LSSQSNHKTYIQLTIELAKKGIGLVSPNPLVGAVIVKDDKIIGVGYHAKCGENHAEINAFNNCKESPEGATLYVNLEPCSHYGKTPPCTDAIIKNKIIKVVIGTTDPNPLVSGKGVKALREAGIEVITGIMEKECLELNKFFFKSITEKVPYVTLKIAQTLDSKIADNSFHSKWITSAESRTYVHELRANYDAVLVGSNTVNIDNPELSVRLLEGRNPKRIILNSKLNLSLDKKIFSFKDDNTIIVCSNEEKENKKLSNEYEKNGIKVLFCDVNKKGKIKIKSVLTELYSLGITSILVEGGNKVFSSFVKKGLFDEIDVFISPKILGTGVPSFSNLGIDKLSNSVSVRLNKVSTLGDDVLLVYKNNQN